MEERGDADAGGSASALAVLTKRAPDVFGGGGHIGTSVTPSGAVASRVAFITVGVAATVPPSPTP
jgi:hypothetical protein